MPKLVYMVSREKLLFLVLSVILIVSVLVVFANNPNPLERAKGVYKPGISPEQDLAVNTAQRVYEEKKKAGEKFDGACLSNDLIPNWVADIIHNPRLPVDDIQSNQCPAYFDGRAKHFVELDTDGKVIRVI